MAKMNFPSDLHFGQLTRREMDAVEDAFADHSLKATQPRKIPILERLDHFTWANFTLPMSTGGLALLMDAQPHKFDGLFTIGKVIYIIDLVMFLTCVVCISIRFARSPGKLKKSLTHSTEGLFFPSFFLSLADTIAGMYIYGHPYCGEWLVTTVAVLFWIYLATTYLVAVALYYQLFSGRSLTLQSMTPAWIMPVFPAMLTGTVASSIAKGQAPAMRMAICVAGISFQGLGFLIAMVMYGIYLHRLMESGLPAPNLRPGMFIAVGPPSFTALAIIGITNALPTNYGYFETHPTAIETYQHIALAMAIFIWSFALWLFGVALTSCLAGIRRMCFHLVWWAFVFPNTGFTISIIMIGEKLESQGILWLGSVMSCLLVLLYLVIGTAHIRAVLNAQILWPGRDEDKDE